ncbi:LysR family transcriptional regulator [Castellaniella defragrans]|nr:LysR family transcriptional regulator [Castellaniella defragrans]
MSLIDEIRVFVSVTHSGSFTTAAALLGIPRPTASLAIQKLERRLGSRLFNRTTRHVKLTPDGEEFFERARLFIEDAESLEHFFHTQETEMTGRLRVDVPSRIARRLIAPALPEFHARHPRLEILLGSSDRLTDLAREGFDCALRVGSAGLDSLIVRPLGRLRMVNCASPDYLARFGMPASPDDLPRHQAIHYLPATIGEQPVPWEWMEGPARHALRMPGPVAVNNVENYIACCLAGLGMIQVPAFDVQEHLDRGELVEVLPAWPAPAMPIQLVHPYARYRPRRLLIFNDWLDGLLTPLLECE